MSWKKSRWYFLWQALRFAKNRSHFKKIQSYRSKWLTSFLPGHNSVADRQAWITFASLDRLDELIRSDFQVFEFGGGGSTLFFCQRAGHVVTVEDHAEWFATLEQTVRDGNYRNWEGYFVEPEKQAVEPLGDYKNPADYRSGALGMSQFSYERYVKTIDRFPEAHFDLILVDGRARPSCILHAIPRLKPGGYLVVDNTERPYYLQPFRAELDRDFVTVLNERYPTPYSPDFTITSIFQKK